MNLIVERVFELASKYGEREILQTRCGLWTYKQLIDDIKEVAKYIDACALESYEPVGLAFPNSWEHVVTLLAAELSNHPAVLFGAALKPREIGYHVKNSDIKKIMAASGLSEFMWEAGGIKQEGSFKAIDCWNFENSERPGNFLPEDFICQLTSGTNGMSKEAVRTGKAVMSEIDDTIAALTLTTDETVLTIPPMHHSYGLIGGTLAPLCSGAKLILLDGFFPAEVKKCIETKKVSILFAVPFMYHLINETGPHSVADFSTLRFCLSAGAPMQKEIAIAFQKHFGKLISQDYGSTETGLMCLNLNAGVEDTSVGKPVGKRVIRAFDENGQLLPFGKVGELRTKSDADARAYLYPSEMNATAYQDGWFCIGDKGSVDENGNVFVMGRKINMINVAGSKADPVEIEEVIADCDGVKEVVVIGVDSGASGQVVKAVIVCDKVEITKKQIIETCQKNLSSFKIPRIIEFVDKLPRSQTGKILKKYLV